MEMITVTAKTVEDAITQASLQLGVSSDRIQYEVVEKGSAGVLAAGKLSESCRTDHRAKLQHD